MDLEHCTEDCPDDVTLRLEDFFDDSVLENEACGICLDVVIDRGVLDCCDHWFCFACIDNWATITNLCPTCKGEFQLITCLPVYDAVGNATVDEQLISRDEDGFVQGKANALSFPSYFINEDAVTCLDGEECKIRNKLPAEEDLYLDTSIACDSCDVWYHALCVGFDPDDTSHSSWLCPRCAKDHVLQDTEDISEQDMSSDHDWRNSCSIMSMDSVLSGKVSISIADAGETAVVVSLVEGKHLLKSAMNPETCTEKETFSQAPEFDQCGDIHTVGQDVNPFSISNAVGNHINSELSSVIPPEKSLLGESLKDFEILSRSLVNEKEKDADANSAANFCPKVEDCNEKFTMLPQKRQLDQSLETDTVESSTLASSSPRKEDGASDIMNIVQSSSTDKKCIRGGVRVKKILRRSECDNESSVLIQKLRSEIRDTVCDKNVSDISKAFDGKLLSAFRAAISTREEETNNKTTPLSLRARNILLQKGKVRENLTKKVYATAGGRRKRAWDRDRAVEFWKHRCLASEPEKVKTLQSVLDLLKKVDPGTEQERESEPDNSLLSRLYLADMSVVPRTEDIKPLSALADEKPRSSTDGGSSQNKRLKTDGNFIVRNQPNGVKMETFTSCSSSKSDKRQWALEVLARKSSLSNPVSSTSREEDQDHSLKGTYPLLAKLPKEMRPVPLSCSHKRIPLPARQAQVYRLAEHFLKSADVSVVHTSAEVELAIADSVNIEREICERSKSKRIYVNLCSQRVLRGKPSVDSAKRTVDHDPGDAEEMLRLAGLFSDSPPNSPPPAGSNFGEDSPAVAAGGEPSAESHPISVIPDEAVSANGSEGLTRSPDEKSLEVNGHSKSDSVVLPIGVRDDDPQKSGDSTIIPEVEGETNEEPFLHCSEVQIPGDTPSQSTENLILADNVVDYESTHRGGSSNTSVPTEPVAAGESTKNTVSKMVEAYVKEHIRPLCKSGVITVEQYRWAVGKTAEKVMKFHPKAENASFLIKEGDKVKKLAEDYVAASQRKEWKPRSSSQRA